MKKRIITLFLILSIFSFSENVIRKVSVTGNSEKEVMPDVATVTFQIKTKNSNLSAATKEANDRMEKFKTALKNKKIDLSQLETLTFFSQKQSEYDYDDDYDDDNDIKGIKPAVPKPENKKPDSYTANISILIKNTDFNQISGLVEFSDGENLQSIKKNFDDNTFAFDINATDTTLDKALNKVFAKLNSARSKIQSLNIPAGNIILGEYKITENFNGKGREQKEIYYVTHNFKITTKNIKGLNSIISLADDNGININGNIQFDISDKEKIASDMYNEAFKQAKSKAESILKSSSLKLASPLVVSEDIEFQQKMIDKIDQSWSFESSNDMVVEAYAAPTAKLAVAERSYRAEKPRINYTPKPIKLMQNISVMYEMK